MNIRACPSEGQGVNKWTFATALWLAKNGWSENRIRKYLTRHSTRSGPKADEEIERAIARAPDWIEGGSHAGSSYKKWPPLDRAKRREAMRNGKGVDELRRASPRKEVSAQQALPILFLGDPLIWIARSVDPEIADTLPLRKWLREAGTFQFIVPSPMISRAIPLNGKSRRCLTNTGPRRFLVVESDDGSIDEQTSILWHLARFAPLVLAVHSAGKSAHGWFYVAHRAEEANRTFMEYAVSLGADDATFSKCQPVRMPGGHRPFKGKQEILFFDPLAIGGGQ